MVNKGISLYIKNILDSIQSIKEISIGLTPHEATEERKTFLAVLSLLVHIGESVSLIKKHFPHHHINDAKNIIALRNILAHDYLAIRKSFVKKILTHYLSVLEVDCQNILKQEGDDHYIPSFIEFAE